MNQWVKGSISIYLALMVAVFLTFAGALCESVMTQTAKNRVRTQTQLALENVFAEYDPELFELYHVFGLDLGRYGSGSPDEALRARLNFYGADTSGCDTDAARYLSDHGGEAFVDQVIRYMKEHNDPAAGSPLSGPDPGGAAEAGLDQIGQEIRTISSLGTQIGDDAEGWALFTDTTGVLGGIVDAETLMPAGRHVSASAIDPGRTVSGRTLTGGFGSFRRDISHPARERVLFDLYVMEIMRNAAGGGGAAGSHVVEGVGIDLACDGGLAYEVEYILSGKESDQKNLASVAERIIAVRFMANLTCLSQDAARLAEIESLAAFVTAAAFVPELEPAVQKALMFGWAYAESAAEVRSLLAGKRIALHKTSDRWTVTSAALLTFAMTGKLAATEASDVPGGVSYEDFLRGFLTAMNIDLKAVRTLDLVEIGVNRMRADGTQFKVDQCLFSVRMSSSCRLPRSLTYRFKTEFGYR